MNTSENPEKNNPTNITPAISRPPVENELFWRDEILQVVFWYCGEGLGKSIGLGELQTFLPAPPTVLNQVLVGMVSAGYLLVSDVNESFSNSSSPETRYIFTPFGSREGARRFADEFAGLTDQAHGECNDPECECQTLGPAACANRAVTGAAHSH